jgi:hypothetical protein
MEHDNTCGHVKQQADQWPGWCFAAYREPSGAKPTASTHGENPLHKPTAQSSERRKQLGGEGA